ncbi:Response regulator protein TmoT [Rubripirellula tenax]|uniref:Response regulator protein TmoT n=1 Tax=Rubripirellula tenax TaxID=2528015 RepID=A0A5C6FJR5_9BACT|nr:response regulator [Rubripirellula tenax]TWU60863.1 Response regulator protein TmoT [Rubripirellula tenax]
MTVSNSSVAHTDSTPTIFVVDDDQAVLDSVFAALRPLGLPVRTFSSAESFLESLADPRPGCVLLDVRMPGMSGIELQRILAMDHAYLTVIMVTGHATVSMSVSTLKNGATDFLEKPYLPDLLRAVVQDAVTTSIQNLDKKNQRDTYQALAADLSPRENEVYELLLQGFENKRVAHSLGISPSTVEKHRLAVVRKMGVDNVTQLLKQKIDATQSLL